MGRALVLFALLGCRPFGALGRFESMADDGRAAEQAIVLSLADDATSASLSAAPPDAADQNGIAWRLGAGARFADGSVTTNALAVQPPERGFKVVEWTGLPLSAAYTYRFRARIGLAARGVRPRSIYVQVVASGDPPHHTDAPSTVLIDRVLSPRDVTAFDAGLGLWPLRENFRLAIRVAAVGPPQDLQPLLVERPRLVTYPDRTRPLLGMAQANLAWRADAVTLIDDMGRAGVRALRTDVRGTTGQRTAELERVIDAMRTANRWSMRVVIASFLDEEDYTSTTGIVGGGDPVVFERTCGWRGGAPKLSAVDPERYRARLQRFVAAAEAAGVRPDAFEVGNEFDYACFNGDFDVGQVPPPSIIAASFRNYPALLRVASETLRPAFPGIHILTFGFAFPGGVSAPGRAATQPIVKIVRSKGGVNHLARFVDGVAIHLYLEDVGARGAIDGVATLYRTISAMDGLLGRLRKPYWVTEWGNLDFVRKFGSCSVPDCAGQRYRTMNRLLEAMNDVTSTGSRIAEAFVYTWADEVPNPTFYAIRGTECSELPRDYSPLDDVSPTTRAVERAPEPSGRRSP